MEGQRPLGPSRQPDSEGAQQNFQLNGIPIPQPQPAVQPLQQPPQQQQPANNNSINPNSFPPRHPMQLNGPQARPSTMTIAGPQQHLPNHMPGTVYLIRGPNGELQLVRLTSAGAPLGTANTGRQIPQAMVPQMPSGVRFQAPPQMGAPGQMPPQLSMHHGQISLPSGQMPGHPHSQAMMGMRPHMMGQTPGQPKFDDPLSKAKQFFSALLSMSKNQSAEMHRTAKSLLQQLVDGLINPDEFARRLQEELKSTAQPVLAPLLKVCLHQMRIGLIKGDIVIEGITPPPASAVSGVEAMLHPTVPPLPQLQNSGNTNSLLIQEQKPSIPPRPPVTKAPSHRKPAQGKSSVQSVSSSVGSEMQHPVYKQIEQLQPHSKSDKLKTPRPPTEKKISARQRKQNAALDQKSKAERDGTSTPVSSRETKEKGDEEDLNDVAAMGGVNLNEESARLAALDLVGTQTRSVDDQALFSGESVRKRITAGVRGLVSDDIPTEVLTIISHAVEARIRNCCERLNVIAEHRSESVRGHSHYRATHDIRGQLKFIEELGKVEKRRREEEEKEALLKAAKSRNRPEDPEHMKLKQKAKELQRVEQEELRNLAANQAALAALVGGRKRPRPDSDGTSAGPSIATGSRTENKSQPYRPKIKRASLRDVIFMAETDPKLSKSVMLYQMFHQLK